MTCIAAIAQDGKVYMAGDSMASDLYERRETACPKVFRVGEFLIGYTSSFRMGQILQYHLHVREQQPDEDDDRYMVVAFVESVRTVMKEFGFSENQNGHETSGTFLVGYRGAIYQIFNSYQCLRSKLGIDSCGSGNQVVMAAMLALKDELPEQRILKALEITVELCATVTAPFSIEVLG